MKIFQQNKKMRKSNVLTFNFSLPAVSTCPGAGVCAKSGYCFALLEQIRYPSAMAYRQRMLDLSKDLFFEVVINDELRRLQSLHAGKQIAIRIHTSGDFYSSDYYAAWCRIAKANDCVSFYAYTKSIALIKHAEVRGGIIRPANLTLIYSLGGKQDHLVDTETDRHSRIFATYEDAIAAGYNAAASEDDSEAWLGTNHRVGLVMFGARKNLGNVALGNSNNKGDSHAA